MAAWPKIPESVRDSVRAAAIENTPQMEAVEFVPYAVAQSCEVLMSSEAWGGAGHKACLQPRISKLF